MTLNDHLAIDWSRDFLARSLAILVATLGGLLPALIARAAWRRANAQLRVMEAAARRLLVCLAGEMVPSVPGVPARSGAVPRQPSARMQRRGQTAGLGLFDPLGAAPAAGAPTVNSQPMPDDGLPALVASGRLQARLDALAALLADPIPAARRLARWMARPARGRSVPIRLGLLPGQSCWRGGPDLLASTLADLHARAVAVLNRPPP